MAFRRRAPKAQLPPTTAPLSMAESRWRGQQLEAARTLVERYCGESSMPPSIAELDAAVAGWTGDDDSRIEMSDLANALGVALGHHLVKAKGLTWVMATDEAGTELAIQGAPGDPLVFPCHLVAQRIVDAQTGFVAPLYDELVAG